MKELTRTQMAVVKRTAQNVKGLRTKLAKINEKVEALEAEAMSIGNTIEQFEAPIRTMTGGFSSEEVLNGTMDAISAQIEEMSKEAHCCDCPIEENVTNEVENTQENVNCTTEEAENNEFNTVITDNGISITTSDKELPY